MNGAVETMPCFSTENASRDGSLNCMVHFMRLDDLLVFNCSFFLYFLLQSKNSKDPTESNHVMT